MKDHLSEEFDYLTNLRDLLGDIGLYMSYLFILSALVICVVLMTPVNKELVVKAAAYVASLYFVGMTFMHITDHLIKKRLKQIIKQKEDL